MDNGFSSKRSYQFLFITGFKNWTKESEFGKDFGAHGGVWECPDLFELSVDGDRKQKKWVLIVSINPGGPIGGSATQYFVGAFDGKSFVNETNSSIKWIDYGADNYAGVTWSGIPAFDGRRIFMGWMSNWLYAQEVPTTPWRSAMTVPRELFLTRVKGEYNLANFPISELATLRMQSSSFRNKQISRIITFQTPKILQSGSYEIEFITPESSGSFDFILFNENNEECIVSYNSEKKTVSVDRLRSGDRKFSDQFIPVSTAPIISNSRELKLQLLVDLSSIEVFLNDGTTVLTSILFPRSPFTMFRFDPKGNTIFVQRLSYTRLRSVW